MGLRWLLWRLVICPNAYYNYLKSRKAEYHQYKARLLTIITQTYHERKGAPSYRLMKWTKTSIFFGKLTNDGSYINQFYEEQHLPNKKCFRAPEKRVDVDISAL